MESAFSLTLEEYRGYLKMLARSQLHAQIQGKLDASDVVQQTLLDAYRNRQQFRGQTQAEMAGWLRQILANNIGGALRAAHRPKRDLGREVSLQSALDTSSMHLEAFLAAEQSSPSMKAQKQEDMVHLANSLDQLPEDRREAVTLRLCHNWSLDQISSHLGKTKKAVAHLLQRGLSQLRELMQERHGTAE